MLLVLGLQILLTVNIDGIPILGCESVLLQYLTCNNHSSINGGGGAVESAGVQIETEKNGTRVNHSSCNLIG